MARRGRKPIWRRWEPSEGMAGALSPESVRIEPECKVRNDMGLPGRFQWELKLSLDGQGCWVRKFAVLPPLEVLSEGNPRLAPEFRLGLRARSICLHLSSLASGRNSRILGQHDESHAGKELNYAKATRGLTMRRVILLLPIVILSVAFGARAQKPAKSAGGDGANTGAAAQDFASTPAPHPSGAYGDLPLSFEANRGQADSQVKYLARGRGYTLFLTPKETVLALRHSLPAAKQKPSASAAAVPPGLKHETVQWAEDVV